LMLERERKKYYAEFLLDGLLRGDNASRSQYYAMAKQWGWMSTNEIREKENMNPVAGGDVYLIPMNMAPAGEPNPQPLPAAGRGETQPQQGARRATLPEARASGAASKRHRVMEGYKPLYADVVRRILRKESGDVSKAVKRTLKGSGWAGLKSWMESYYETHADQIKEQMMPLGKSYGQQVADLAAQELNDEPPDESVTKFTESYVGGYSARHAAISQSKVEQKYMKAVADEVDAEEALLNELELWPDERSPQIADEESVRFGNAMAKMVYGALGVVTLRFVTFGENCPYCDQMDGRVIGIEENFISAGGSIEADGAEPLTSTTDIGHPPIHSGCDCMVVAG